MIFGRKKEKEDVQQKLRDIMEDVLEDVLSKGQEMAQEQLDQTKQMGGMIEKNQKAVERLSDSVEDFLDTLQEEKEEEQKNRQRRTEAEEREHGLLLLLGLYQEQMELSEQWMAGQKREDREEALRAWEQQYAMLKAKIAAESRLCGIEAVGTAGEPADYRLHEILQAVEPDSAGQEGTVAKVYSQGMLYNGKVLKKARVAAYRKE